MAVEAHKADGEGCAGEVCLGARGDVQSVRVGTEVEELLLLWVRHKPKVSMVGDYDGS